MYVYICLFFFVHLFVFVLLLLLLLLFCCCFLFNFSGLAWSVLGLGGRRAYGNLSVQIPFSFQPREISGLAFVEGCSGIQGQFEGKEHQAPGTLGAMGGEPSWGLPSLGYMRSNSIYLVSSFLGYRLIPYLRHSPFMSLVENIWA